MTEEFLSFLWKYRLYNADNMVIDGNKVQILNPGELNHDSGPDFFNAKLKIGDTIWAGNIEIHQRSSDWNRHGHDKNAAFDNVVIHIVGLNDQVVYTSKGREVATVSLDFDPAHLINYDILMMNKKWIPCAGNLSDIEPVILSTLLTKVEIERLELRTSQIMLDLDKTANDWDETFYRQIARSYGFHVNSQPFEALAKSIPFIIAKKYCHNYPQLEALYFGQAGFLQDDYSFDDYYNNLKKEYEFLKVKHHLQPIESHVWKFMRLRPGNFPTIRIAQFVGLIGINPSLFATVLDAGTLDSLYHILSANVSEYWQSHYTFGNLSRSVAKTLGKESAKILIINTIVPFYFIYGKKMGLVEYQDKALEFLENMDAEDNAIIKDWKRHGVKPKNAFDSQALLHLKNEYCDKKRCIECAIGVEIISKG
jgi:Protein of unknown function (DUF2851)